MAITTLDGLIAGMQYPREFIKVATPTLVAGRPHSLFYLDGVPGAAVAPTPGKPGEALTSYPGQLPFTNPVSGNSYLARLAGQATIAGQLLLCDRLWHNSGVSGLSNQVQAVDSVAWPARSADGTVDGEGVLIGVEISAVSGSYNADIIMGYTNQAGTSGRTATGQLRLTASSAVGAFHPIGLQADDSGVRSVQTIYFSNSGLNGGTVHLVAYRILARLDLTAAQIPRSLDAVTSGMPQLFDNTVPFLLFIPSTTTASLITGHAVWSQG